jgi:hypothetical protein
MLLHISITNLDINDRQLFHFEYDVSETIFCLRLVVEITQFGPIDRASLFLRFGPEDGDPIQFPERLV